MEEIRRSGWGRIHPHRCLAPHESSQHFLRTMPAGAGIAGSVATFCNHLWLLGIKYANSPFRVAHLQTRRQMPVTRRKLDRGRLHPQYSSLQAAYTARNFVHTAVSICTEDCTLYDKGHVERP